MTSRSKLVNETIICMQTYICKAYICLHTNNGMSYTYILQYCCILNVIKILTLTYLISHCLFFPQTVRSYNPISTEEQF